MEENGHDAHLKKMISGIKAKLFQRRNTVALARWLIGKHLVRRWPDGREEARMITETEAYHGEADLACHARAGRTRRTEVMYGPGGTWYVYLCYGIHEMLNLVVGPSDWPAAILIRGVEHAHGPGRVTKALAIDRTLNARPAARASGLWIEDRGTKIPRRDIQATPRVGIDYAGPIWTAKHWRFVLLPATRAPKARPAESPPGRPSLESGPRSRRAAASAPPAPAVPRLPHPSARRATRTESRSRPRGG